MLNTKVSKNIKVTLHCDGLNCKSQLIDEGLQLVVDKAQKEGWHVVSSSFPIREDTLGDVLCKNCWDKKKR